MWSVQWLCFWRPARINWLLVAVGSCRWSHRIRNSCYCYDPRRQYPDCSIYSLNLYLETYLIFYSFYYGYSISYYAQFFTLPHLLGPLLIRASHRFFRRRNAMIWWLVVRIGRVLWLVSILARRISELYWWHQAHHRHQTKADYSLTSLHPSSYILSWNCFQSWYNRSSCIDAYYAGSAGPMEAPWSLFILQGACHHSLASVIAFTPRRSCPRWS